jgi:nicotinamide-nucleotide adenylyltransferase
LQRTGLFIGRFQPFHNGHLATVKFALTKVETLVIVVGSAQKSHEPRNPFTAGERISMIKETIRSSKEIDGERILIIPVPDVEVHSLWTRQVDMLVPEYEVVIANDPFTLLLFKERGIKVIEAPLHKRNELEATQIRELMAHGNERWTALVPLAVSKIIKKINGERRVKAIAENNKHGRHHD